MSETSSGGGAPGPQVSRRGAVAVLGIALVVAVGFAVWHRPGRPPPEAMPTPEVTVALVPVTTVAPARVTVHVSGAVAVPGLVVLPEGSRVADAIARAGGVLAGSDLSLINLASPVVDGDHLVVPWAGAAAAPPGASDADPGTGPVDLNRADPAGLARIPGVGPVLAERIVSHREAHGPFTTLEDLLSVEGIGEGRLAGMRGHAVVGR